MNTTEGRVAQLRRARDEAKRQLDEVSSQRDHLRMQRQQLANEADHVESIFQVAVGQGNLTGMQNAKARARRNPPKTRRSL